MNSAWLAFVAALQTHSEANLDAQARVVVAELCLPRTLRQVKALRFVAPKEPTLQRPALEAWAQATCALRYPELE